MPNFKAIVSLWSASSQSLAQLAPARPPHSGRRHKFSLEHLETRVVPSTILVTSLLDSGHGTLRAAIERANQGRAIRWLRRIRIQSSSHTR